MADLTGIGEVAGLARDVVNKIWPDKSDQEKMELAGAIAAVQGQIDTNKAEAANPSLFVSGWRPSVGWVCSGALAFQMILAPMIQWGAVFVGKTVVLPPLDTGTLIGLLMSLLGLGGMRTIERLNGVNRK